MVAAKSFDAAAWKPGVVGSAADCVSEYTQVKDADMARLFKLPRRLGPMVWTRIPKDRRPNWRHEQGFVAPAAPLLADLWGHLLAGLPWGKYLEEELTQSGWKKQYPWKGVYYHKRNNSS